VLILEWANILRTKGLVISCFRGADNIWPLILEQFVVRSPKKPFVEKVSALAEFQDGSQCQGI
jgi:hypothetical protein